MGSEDESKHSKGFTNCKICRIWRLDEDPDEVMRFPTRVVTLSVPDFGK